MNKPKFLIILLLFSLLTSYFVVLSEEMLYFSDLEEIYYQDNPYSLTFYSALPGSAYITLSTPDEKPLFSIVENFPAKPGFNKIDFNLSSNTLPFEKSEYILMLSLGENSIKTNINISGPKAYFSDVSINSSILSIDQELTLSFSLSENGFVSLTTTDKNHLKHVLYNSYIEQDTVQNITWSSDSSKVEFLPGTYKLSLEFANSNGTTLESYSFDLLLVDDKTNDESSNLVKTNIESKNDTFSYAPSDLSEHECEHEHCYWKLPIGDLNEKAIWEAMMQPIVVVKPTRKTAADRQSFFVYEEPDKASKLVAEVTAVSQGVHVIKTLDNGWSLIEGYSSSFNNKGAKNYGGFFQGYIENERLETKNPSDKYGLLIDKLNQKMYILTDGKIFSELTISTGRATPEKPHHETPPGEYLVVSWTGGFYSGNLWCALGMRINAGILMHEIPSIARSDGTPDYGYGESRLGEKASAGCIRVQRDLTPEGTNMQWLWDNLKRNTRVFIWEDKGRMREIPDAATSLYYNPDGGKNYHSAEYCSIVRNKFLPLSPFTYGQLDDSPFDKLTPCPGCNPPDRKELIEDFNRSNALFHPSFYGSILGSIDGDTQLYYNPNKGSYYHTDEKCSTVSKRFLPMTSFTYTLLGEQPFDKLDPCPVCKPPIRGLHIAESSDSLEFDSESSTDSSITFGNP